MDSISATMSAKSNSCLLSLFDNLEKMLFSSLMFLLLSLDTQSDLPDDSIFSVGTARGLQCWKPWFVRLGLISWVQAISLAGRPPLLVIRWVPSSWSFTSKLYTCLVCHHTWSTEKARGLSLPWIWRIHRTCLCSKCFYVHSLLKVQM